MDVIGLLQAALEVAETDGVDWESPFLQFGAFGNAVFLGPSDDEVSGPAEVAYDWHAWTVEVEPLIACADGVQRTEAAKADYESRIWAQVCAAAKG